MTITSGATQAAFFSKDSTAGARTISVNSPGYVGASQIETVSPGPA